MANTSQIRDNEFYRRYYQIAIMVLIGAIFFMLCMVTLVMYQVKHRPLPVFTAVDLAKQTMPLVARDEPNLLPATLIRWTRKAATLAYTFDFVNYYAQGEVVRPYFTEAGWQDFRYSIQPLINRIRQNQLFVNGIVAGPPVISNQGYFPGRGYVWRIQMPFLVTYQSADSSSRRNFVVLVTIVRVPTWINPAAVGIDQFVMRG